MMRISPFFAEERGRYTHISLHSSHLSLQMSTEEQVSTSATENLSKNALKKQLKAAKAAQAKAEKEAAKVRIFFYKTLS
jgi:hypothetical protein